MKFLHLSDLHIGKTVHEFSMLEDQEYILKSILKAVNDEKPQIVLIAGDIFDRSIAPAEALQLFNDFLESIVRRNIEVFIISGNHDSADRLAFGSGLMEKSGVHISRVYNGNVAMHVIHDKYGEINLYMLPFLKPAQIKRFFPDNEIDTWTDAIRTVIDNMNIDETKRNILMTHQFVTGAATCDSEERNAGGADNVDADVFMTFDYAALGHLHGAQIIGKETIRYCGTPLKYSFSEVNHTKTLTFAELGDKGNISIKELPLAPKRDMREIKGKYLEISSLDFHEKQNKDDYIRITLTDEDDQPDAMQKLRVIYPKLMQLNYDNKRTRAEGMLADIEDVSQYKPVELFNMFYEQQNGSNLSEIQYEFLNSMIEEIWEAKQ